MSVVLSATIMLVDLFVAIMQETVSVAIMQLEVSAGNMWVKTFIEIMQVGISVAIMQVRRQKALHQIWISPLKSWLKDSFSIFVFPIGH